MVLVCSLEQWQLYCNGNEELGKKKMILNGAEAYSSLTSSLLVHIFSAYDATLMSLLCFFHIERPSVWPEYGSYLKMELLQDNRQVLSTLYNRTEKERHYGLFSLNDTPLRSGFGGKKDQLVFFVPWIDFEQELQASERRLPPLALCQNG